MTKFLPLALVAIGTAAFAHTGVKDPVVMGRMVGMTDIAEQTKLIGAMAKGQVAFDAEAANAALRRIADEAARIPTLFEARVIDPNSEALPGIWDRFDTFTALAVELEELATGLDGTVASAADLGQAVQRIGKSCSACHSEFRK